MIKLTFLPILLLVTSISAAEFPKDVLAYIKNADSCDHLSGEINGDNSEADKRIVSDMNKYCATAENVYMKLRKKYASNPRILEKIGSYEFIKDQ
jgi:hypothetical protein